ncbi:alpha/beta fold hydrolase [Sporosarcina sp. Marseille-Q4943]|uniref:alpha/beta fold hydrolase n=1 Tax=Sporosarcina sp. Marseille-Q4943 TaxID=2942204 RepID=UPI00208DCF1B|nr:alpha/beta hydrolase [Sporosarcina sp. Marseille-Q4943]
METNILDRNYVHVSGSGDQTIMFAHGFGCDQTVWNNIMPAFEPDYRVVLIDYVGSGRSDKSAYSRDRYDSLYGYAQDVIDVYDALELESIIYVGHSVAGMIGTLVSIKRPDLIEKLIMIGSSPHYLNEPDYYGGFEEEDIHELLDMMETNYLEWAKYLAPIATQNDELAEDFEARLKANDPAIARQFAEVTFYSDHREDLPKISARTLILQTSTDAIAPPEVGQFLHEQIPGSELVMMKTARGHNPHISHPEETVQEIRRFIDGTGV